MGMSAQRAGNELTQHADLRRAEAAVASQNEGGLGTSSRRTPHY
jgi:hypothetical protein